MKKTLSLVILILSFCSGLVSQETKFRNFGVEQGICNSQIYDIEQDKNGFLWLGTSEGLCKYNGFVFSKGDIDTLSNVTVSTMFKDGNDNLWIGFQNGDVLIYNGFDFKLVISGTEIGNSKILGFVEIEEGVIAASQNRGLVLVNNEGEKKAVTEPFNQFYLTSINLLSGKTLLVGTFEGLMLIDITNFESPEMLHGIEQLEYIQIQTIARIKENTFFVGTNGAGLYELVFDGNNADVHNIGADWNITELNIQDIYVDWLNDVWLSTFGKGLFRLIYNSEKEAYIELKNYSTKNGLGADDIKGVFQDVEGNYWIGTYTQGLSCLTDEAFLFYDFSDKSIGKNITALATYDNFTWYASGNVILKEEQSVEKKLTYIRNGLPNDPIKSMYFDGNYLWVGTESKGLFRVSSSNQVMAFDIDNNSLARTINHITGSKDSLWVSTRNGIYLFLNNYTEKKHFSTNTGMSHNNINQVYVDNENNAWIATKSGGLMYLDKNLQLNFVYSELLREMQYNSIVKDRNNRIWAGTAGFGVLMFEDDTLYSFSINEGIKSGYCYSLKIDKNEMLWIGHSGGISRLNTKNLSFKVYDSNHGIVGDCNYNALITNDKNELIFGTTEGIVIYNPAKDAKEVHTPMLNIVSVLVSHGDVQTRYGIDEAIVLPYGKYGLRIDFIGLSYKSPQSIKYQYKLDGNDEWWSDLSEMRYATWTLTDGNYTFMIKACNGENVCNEEPITLSIKIKKPFWKKISFIILMVALMVFVVIMIIKIRERKQKELQEYLQTKLDERTREVVKQKEEIEIKNRDITDSINYAQRIQASILPSIKTLQTYFTGSFVFYQPRDIVSGDFYWFGLTKDNKFVIVCADSTGHGVPGAFMSMIGTILLKDICARPDVIKPSDILNRLDEELSNTLNQNVEAERSNDGMDIIVCEIDIKTYYTRIASAMRPIIVYQNGQQIYVKGSRNSVGGHLQKEEKVFQNEGFQLAKGDIIYMFSDGYPDQFGGPMEKKFKMVRLKNLLKDINQKPMDDQFTQVKNTFNLWKEGLDQVDDVLFMGIKI